MDVPENEFPADSITIRNLPLRPYGHRPIRLQGFSPVLLQGKFIMLFESKVFWLSLFYLFWASAVVFVVVVYRLVNRKRFRSAEESTEVGYEEDSMGRVLHETGEGDIIEGLSDSTPAPHYSPTGMNNSGPM
jgi:hypothetical protein